MAIKWGGFSSGKDYAAMLERFEKEAADRIDASKAYTELKKQNLTAPINNTTSNNYTTMLTNIFTWIKGNILITVLILVAGIFIFKPTLLRGLTGSARRRTHRRNVRRAITGTIRRRRTTSATRSRSRSTSRRRNKKPWQVKGSLAARRRMAQIRRRRAA